MGRHQPCSLAGLPIGPGSMDGTVLVISTWSRCNWRGFPSSPTRPPSSTRQVTSEDCWISASRTPAPIEWIVPAGRWMMSPRLIGCSRSAREMSCPDLASSTRLSTFQSSLKPTWRVAPGIASRMIHASLFPHGPRPSRLASLSSGWTCTDRSCAASMNLKSKGSLGGDVPSAI